MLGRNDLCPCGSGKKFKKCCLNTSVPPVRPQSKPKLKFNPGFDQEKVNAYHEAGHAVIGALEGPGTKITTIDPARVLQETGKSMIGYTNYIGAGRVEIGVDTYLIMALAGVTSEAMYATNGTVSVHEDDFTFADEILDASGYAGDAKQEKFLQARLRTQELVKKYEKEIQIVGDAINQRKTLVAEDIRSLLGMNGKSDT